MTTRLLMHHVSCNFLVKHQITHVTQPPYSANLALCDFWLFPKLKSPLKGKRFQTISEIQANMMGRLLVTGRTVWGPKVPTLKRTVVLSLTYIQCFLHLVSSSVNVSIFHCAWVDTFWTGLYILKFCFYSFPRRPAGCARAGCASLAQGPWAPDAGETLKT